MVIADDEGEIRAASLQRDDDGVAALGLDVGDRLDQRLGRRFRVFAAMVIDRRHHVVGVKRLAVMELDALANLETPCRGVGRGFPAFRQFRRQFSVLAYFRQMVVQEIVDTADPGVLVGRRIERVGRRAVPPTGP